jgi:flavin-dependent dehydrogenase
MINKEIIIVGGGPAGAACAWKLKQRGITPLVLDKYSFPRPKVCAGWITPAVFRLLELRGDDYPYTVSQFDRINFHLFGLKIPVPTRQYAVRRYEFDAWLICRTGVPVNTHCVRNIIRKNGFYIIDDQYQCKYLIGAGGTHCPVYKTFFTQTRPRRPKSLIVAVEKEYPYDILHHQCHLWFFDHGLPGYAWYLPKGNNWLNIGIGAKFNTLKQRGQNIMDQWRHFTMDLQKKGFIGENPPSPKGHNYYFQYGPKKYRQDNAFIIGDAAGLSTLDMGEGIHGAVLSGIRVADAIVENKPFVLPHPARFSLPKILLPN